jgi:hypothetical protein
MGKKTLYDSIETIGLTLRANQDTIIDAINDLFVRVARLEGKDTTGYPGEATDD